VCVCVYRCGLLYSVVDFSWFVSVFVCCCHGFICSPMLDIFNILCRNAWGLNDPNRCVTVYEVISTSTSHIVCLQESKLEFVSPADALFIGGNRLRSFTVKPSVGTRGGILLL
jgi:hypothetical protein